MSDEVQIRADVDFFDMVREFHDKFDMYNGLEQGPHFPSNDIMTLRNELLLEELKELIDSMKQGDIVGVADGLTDVIYVTLGWAISYGIDLRPIFQEIHRSNMEKAGGGKRDDGKILKPNGWKPPQVKEIVTRQMHLAIEKARERR